MADWRQPLPTPLNSFAGKSRTSPSTTFQSRRFRRSVSQAWRSISTCAKPSNPAFSNQSSFAVEAFKKELAAFGWREVMRNARPCQCAGCIVHPATDYHPFGSLFLHHFSEKAVVQIGRGVSYQEARVRISVGLDFRDPVVTGEFHRGIQSKSSPGNPLWRIMERRVPIGMSLRGWGMMTVWPGAFRHFVWLPFCEMKRKS